MVKGKSNKSLRRKSETFKPSRVFIKSAVEEFLNRGGKITELVSKSGYHHVMQGNQAVSEADEFLCESSILHQDNNEA